ncbi:MAG: 30S ribosome-binding factor RbfA [Candidatus Sericytochromatia bacterium]
MAGNRPAKVAEAVKREMADLLLKDIKDARVKSVIISPTNVEVSGDLRHVTIFVSIFANDIQKKEAMKGLDSAKGFIRTEISERINLRFAPEIHFKLDESMDKANRIFELIEKTKVQD